MISHDDRTHALPPLGSAFAVFSQENAARIDVAAWDAHAARFFSTRLELEGDAAAAAPVTPPVGVVVRPDGGPPGVRYVYARPRLQEDLALADQVEEAGAGLAGLARRCHVVWLVARESDDDALALRLAAILASVFLGPILDAPGRALFGVKSARERLERPAGRPEHD